MSWSSDNSRSQAGAISCFKWYSRLLCWNGGFKANQISLAPPVQILLCNVPLFIIDKAGTGVKKAARGCISLEPDRVSKCEAAGSRNI